MQHKTCQWKSPDGLQFFGQTWAPEQGAPQALICLVHGMGEHSGRYEEFCRFFTQKGYAVFALDVRGHGKTQGKRGHTPSFVQLMQDMEAFLQEADKLFGNLPRFLMGHSMGGNMVLNYTLRHNPELKGVISSSAFLELAFQPAAWQLALANVMKSIYPSLTQPTNLEVEALSRDKVVVEAYKKDPLVHDKISVRFFLETQAAAQWALNNAEHMDLPLLMFHGTDDRLTAASGSQKFAAKVKQNIKFKWWEGAYHEIHHEPEKETLFTWIWEWTEEHK